MNAKNIMIQGTMSGVGKSLITAGLCRIYTRRGLRVAPFKSQNMALNSYVTADGGEIGTATALQAIACEKEPTVEMNPVLLKPSTDTESQVIVNGRAVENLSARDYFKKKKSLMPTIISDYKSLAERNDLIVIEGAGSCCELNLRQDDIVNMGLATAVNAPVLLVGDIDRGGIFAQLYGSMKLLPENEQKLIKGLVVNKFRGDPTLFQDGVDIIGENTGRPVVGVLPYTRLELPEEDSLSERLSNREVKDIDIVVIRFPKISNYTDFLPLERQPEVSVRYVDDVKQMGNPDMIILPGTKNTIADLRWLKKTHLASFIKKSKRQIPILGICGGYQMLGRSISDPEGIEEGGEEKGLELLPMQTVMNREKTTRQMSGYLENGELVKGYEIHCGVGSFKRRPWPLIWQIKNAPEDVEGVLNYKTLVAGTYWHGFFDEPGVVKTLIDFLNKRKGGMTSTGDQISQREATIGELDRFADILEANLDMDFIDSLVL
ncbi:MAG: cobyric acid synthase [Lachnospiraceae bacterium]|nr:cobyric acid synthase [Lachnospiraceae bacterium]